MIVVEVMIVLALLGGVFAAAVYFGQRRLLYVADRARTSPNDDGLTNVTEIEIAAPDGARVVAWHGPARPRQPTLLYFHGNAGTLATRAPRIERFMAEGWGVMMMTYRGYGGSSGRPTEAHNVADAIRAHDRLVGLGAAAQDIVLYGESLGTGVATQVALARPAAGLILDAPYTSIAEMAVAIFGINRVARYVRDRYDTASIIGRVSVPLLILHGTLDRTIPVAMGRRLFELARQPKTMAEFPYGGHSDLYVDGNNALAAVRTFIEGLKR